MAFAVVTVVAGGLPVVDVTAITPTLGLPVTEALSGIAVTKVTMPMGGLPVTFVSDGGQSLAQDMLYTKGPYSAFVHSFNAGGTFVTTTTVVPATFPLGSSATWTITGGDSTTVKGFLDLGGYGNYLNTVPETASVPAQIGNITTLTITHAVTASGSNYNLIYDYFLASDVIGTTRTHEIMISSHISAAGISYFNSLTTVGTTTISSISWDVKIDNAASPKIVFIVPTDRADRFSGTWDHKAMLAYLVAQTVTTGITNKHFFVGLGFGAEPIQGTGSISLDNYVINYVAGLPIQTNLITNQNLTNAYWNKSGTTASASDTLMETAATSQHGVLLTTPATRAAGVKTFVCQMDVAVVGTPRQGLVTQIFDGSFGHSATAPMDIVGKKALWVSAGGSWTNVKSISAPLASGDLRCFVQWTTDAASTNVQPFPQISPDPLNNTVNYAGDVSRGMAIRNIYIFDKDT